MDRQYQVTYRRLRDQDKPSKGLVTLQWFLRFLNEATALAWMEERMALAGAAWYRIDVWNPATKRWRLLTTA